MGDRHRVPVRTLRVPDDLWARVKQKAREEGRTVHEVILRLLREYVEKS